MNSSTNKQCVLHGPRVLSLLALGAALSACILPGANPSSNGDGTGGSDWATGGAPAGSGGAPAGSGGAPAGSGGAPAGSGGAPAGSGGTNASGGTTAAGGLSTGGGGAPAQAIGGYIRSGRFQGYAWTAAAGQSTTIAPADFSASTDFPLCVRGSVGASYQSTAMLGWNLSQDARDGSMAMTIVPGMDGLRVQVTNPGGSALRLQIQGPRGATDPNDRWCAPITGSGGFLPYDAFNTECWVGGMGQPYRGQPIVAAIVLVPGNPNGTTAFDFCLAGLSEATNMPMMPAGTGCALQGGPGEGGGTITGDDIRVVTRLGRSYIVQNNVWNGNKQAQQLSVRGVSFEVTAQGNSQSTQGAPASFPSVFIGSNFGRSSPGSNLPKRVGALTKVPTAWRWSASSSGQWNAAYDVWFSRNPGGDSGSPSGGYLMVWLFKPSNAQPLGRPVGVESVAGRSWQVWTCPGACQNGVPAISYVPANNQSIPELSFDLNDFIRHARQRYPDLMNENWYLSNIFAGFEIWSGGVGLRTDDFCAIVE